MAQEVKIGVNADVAGAEANMKRLDQAADRVSDTVGDIAESAQRATAQLEAMERATRRLASAQQTLQSHFGRRFSEADTAQALANFGKMKSGRGIGAKRLQTFDSFDAWWDAGGGSFTSAGGRAQHQQYVLNNMVQGTAAQGAGPGPALPPGMTPGGGFGGGGGAMRPGGAPGFGTSSGWLGKAASTAMGVVGGGLALAGIGGFMSMAGRAIDLATSEARSIDEIKRRTGGLGVSYYGVQAATRGAADALRTDYVGAAGLGSQFVAGAGNFNKNDIGQLGTMLQNVGHFATAMGIDNGTATDFFSSMKRVGVAGDDRSQEKLAGRIADAIDRSGYAAAGAELVKAVQANAQVVARYSLSRPNATGYAAAIANLGATGLPGLDPTGAAALLNTADGALQHGGNAGEAGKNFLFNALYQPGMGPFSVMGLMQGGLFASTRSVFGKNSALRGWYRGPLDDTQNIDRIRSQVSRMGLDPQAAAASMASVFGLSMGQANALLTLNGKPLQDAKAAIAAREKDAQKDPYQSIIDAVNDVSKALTDAGQPLLSAINPIREGVASLVQHFVGTEPGQQDRLKGVLTYHPDGNNLFGDLANTAKRVLAQGRMNLADYAATGVAAGWDRKLGLPGGAIELQMYHESHFKDGARSRAGAMGWGQFMPGTVASLKGAFHAQFWHDPNVWNHMDAVNLTGLYMQQLLKRYGGDYNKALAAYNAGPGRVDRAIRSGHGLPKETRDYVAALGTPIPAHELAPVAAGGQGSMKHEVHGTVVVKDAAGQVKGTTILRQVGQPQASGTG